ncbi:hypothetical protein DL93DRAFT_2229432 [Clavulina sp. PMI_390]|nr:hypothetical protein DL93DRAFT_2229432 [Clavulina sp. PMI_390]
MPHSERPHSTANPVEQPPSPTPSLSTILTTSRHPLPSLPTLTNDATWDTVFTHASLPYGNGVLAALGESVWQSAVMEWLIESVDGRLTEEELDIRTEERLDPTLLQTFSSIYALPSQLTYARTVHPSERYSAEDKIKVFEAYVGGMLRDRGWDVFREWVAELLEWDNMTMLDSLKDQETAVPQDKTAGLNIGSGGAPDTTTRNGGGGGGESGSVLGAGIAGIGAGGTTAPMYSSYVQYLRDTGADVSGGLGLSGTTA